MGTEQHIQMGYQIIRLADYPDHNHTGLVPPMVLSVSGCICESIPGPWCIDYASRPQEREPHAATFGLSPAAVEELVRWSTDALDRRVFWPSTLADLATAREVAERFLPDRDRLKLVGLSLPHTETQTMLKEIGPSNYPFSEGFAHWMERWETVAPTDGILLGYEVLGLDINQFHSWLCNWLEKMVYEKAGIRSGRYGLIQSEADAFMAARLCNECEGTEPVQWHAWALREYAW